MPSSGLHPEAAADQQPDQSRRLRRALAQLGEEQRDVVVMRFIEGMSIVEVAATLHKSEDAVKGLQRSRH